MADNQLGDIEREIEETRDRLAATIDQLAHRASPKTIAGRQVNSFKGYFIDANGAPRQDNIIKVAGGFVGVVVLFALVRKITR